MDKEAYMDSMNRFLGLFERYSGVKVRLLPEGVEIIDQYEGMEGDKVVLSRRCDKCKFPYERSFMADEVRKWMNMTSAQEAFPDVHKEWRELFFISGICGKCWNSMFVFDPDSE